MNNKMAYIRIVNPVSSDLTVQPPSGVSSLQLFYDLMRNIFHTILRVVCTSWQLLMAPTYTSSMEILLLVVCLFLICSLIVYMWRHPRGELKSLYVELHTRAQ